MKTVRKPEKILLSGIRTTGPLHLGHYVGALSLWLPFQKTHQCFFLLADIQGLTTHFDNPERIRQSVTEVALDFLGVGLDPSLLDVHFVVQSMLEERAALYEVFQLITNLAELERNPTIKEELEQLRARKQSVNFGFIGYPCSQAADILFVTPLPPHHPEDELVVPVGEDQKPHLELTNVIARRFNHQYGKVFVPCRYLSGETPRLIGTDGKAKMSKSLGNAIQLKDSADVVTKQVMNMFTDPEKLRKGDPGHPEGCPAFQYFQTFAGADQSGRATRCRSGELGCVECKRELALVINKVLDPIRERRNKFEAQPEKILQFLRDGTEVARERAQKTMSAVRRAMRIDYY